MSLITISEYRGCGGREIAVKVAADLKLDLYDDARLQGEAMKTGLGDEELKGMEEKLPRLFDRLFRRNPEIYLDMMQALVYRAARKGQGVIVGHGSQVLLREFGCAMHIRVFAPKKIRISRLQTEQNITLQEAEKIVRNHDRDFNDFFKFAFSQDYNDPSLYDLVVNTAKISSATVAAQIVALAESEDMQTCSLSALQAIERLALQKKVHSTLRDQGISLKTIFIDVPDSGLARLYGIATNAETRTRIVEIVRRIPEVSHVETKILIKAQAEM